MSNDEILDAIRESGITKEQLAGMLTKNAILVKVEEKRAELARTSGARDAFMETFNKAFAEQVAPFNADVERLQAELDELQKLAAQQL